MKVTLHPPVHPVGDESPATLAAQFAINKVRRTFTKTDKMERVLVPLIRKTCSQVYSDALNGGKGEPVHAYNSPFMVRVVMKNIDNWEIDIFQDPFWVGGLSFE